MGTDVASRYVPDRIRHGEESQAEGYCHSHKADSRLRETRCQNRAATSAQNEPDAPMNSAVIRRERLTICPPIVC